MPYTGFVSNLGPQTGTSGGNNPATSEAFYKRVGDSILLQIREIFNMGSTSFPGLSYVIGADSYLPPGLTLDLTRDLAPSIPDNISLASIGTLTAIESTNLGEFPSIRETSALIRSSDGTLVSTIAAGDIDDGGNPPFTSTVTISITTRQLPIQGWEV